MKKPQWLTELFIFMAHAELVDKLGGLEGPCKENLLHSALNRPKHLFAYGKPNLFDLAAAYGFELAKNHAFVDGNKRTAFIAMQTFLDINGWEILVDPREVVIIMIGVASGQLTEKELSRWLKKNSQPITIKN